MTIKFADPGFDWTLLIVLGSILALILLIAGFFGLLYVRRGYRSNAGNIAFGFLMGAVVFGILGIGMGGGIGSPSTYRDHVEVALYEALEDAGFDQIDITYDEDLDTQTINALLDGEEFYGTIENLYYPKDYAYKVVELEDAK